MMNGDCLMYCLSQPSTSSKSSCVLELVASSCHDGPSTNEYHNNNAMI